MELDTSFDAMCLLSLMCERGFFGEVLADRPFGSSLHLLDREKRTQETLDLAREYVMEALKWTVEYGFSKDLEVQTSFRKDDGALLIDVKVGGTLKEYAIWD